MYNKLILQERYFKKNTVLPSQKAQCWWVPLTYTTKEIKDFKTTKPKQWLSCNDSDVVVENLKRDSWVILNIQAGGTNTNIKIVKKKNQEIQQINISGLYRVNYDMKNWKMLSDFLHTSNFKDIHNLNRVLLIEDSMSLASAGYLDYSVPFDLLTYLKEETEYLPWKIALLKIAGFTRQFKRTPDYGLLQVIFTSNELSDSNI